MNEPDWTQGTCILSGESCQVDQNGDATRFDSVYCGTYIATGSADRELEAEGGPFPRLMRWVYEQNRSGEKWPTLDTHNWRRLNTRPSLKATDRVRELLRLIRDKFQTRRFEFGLSSGGVPINEAIAFATCDLPPEPDLLRNVIQNCRDAGYINNVNQVTFAGHAFLELLESSVETSDQAFVAMWFEKDLTTRLFGEVIEPSALRAGYRAFRIDRKDYVGKIDDEIIGEIRRSRFLIADFSCQAFEVGGITHLEHRGGVYFEAGFAYGLGIPVIWTCKEDLVEYIHFDTRQYNHLLWSADRLSEFAAALERRIRAVVGQGPLA